MGTGLAGPLLRAGHDVCFYDINSTAAVSATERMRGDGPGTLECGSARAGADLSDTVSDADWIIETVAEDLAVKQALLVEVERHGRPSAVISSNSSSFMPSELSASFAHPERFLNTHFFRPADLAPLVEVVPGPRTDAAVVSSVQAWLRAAGKRPVVIEKEIRGFVANRLQIALLREALYLLESGVARADQIDEIVENSIGPRLGAAGPFVITDLGGLDVFAAICDAVFPTLAGDSGVQRSLRERVAAGRLGVKSGAGFRDDPARWQRAADDIAQRFARPD